MNEESAIIALDVGDVRIGVARASGLSRLAAPLVTLSQGDTVIDELRQLCRREHAERIVIGLPRGMSGQETAQTAAVRAFGRRVAAEIDLPVSWQDESVTSVQAEAELQHRGKPYRKQDIDALAATYILEDYLRENV